MTDGDTNISPASSGWQMALDRKFVALLSLTAVPVALQSMISLSRTLVDSLFVSQLGTDEIAAIGYASRVMFVVMLTIHGMADGAAIVTAQFWGGARTEKTRQATALTVALTGATAAIAFAFCSLGAEEIVSIGSNDKSVVSLGSAYIRIAILSLIPFAIISALAASVRCSGEAKVTMKFALAGLAFHVIMAYILIFGEWGFPQLGLIGTAWATTISACIECLIFVAYLYSRHHPMAFNFQDLRQGVTNGLLGKICRIGIPVSLSSASWAFGSLMYGILVGRSGTEQLAALSVINPFESVASVMVGGVASAASVVIGQSIGKGVKEEEIWILSKAFLIWSAAVSIILGAIISSLYFWMAQIYGDGINSNTLDIARSGVVVVGAVFIFRATNMVLQNGLLRAGGDATYILCADLACRWVISVPITFMVALVWKLPFPLIILSMYSEEIAITCLSGHRVRRRRWAKSVVENAQSG